MRQQQRRREPAHARADDNDFVPVRSFSPPIHTGPCRFAR